MRTSSQIITGAPINDVIALIGRLLLAIGKWASVSQKSITIAPVIAVAGNNILCNDVLNSSLLICGIAKPIKAIGPTKEVILPVSKLVVINIINCVLLKFTPMLFA